MKNKYSLFHIGLLIIVGFIAYCNTYNVPFHFDDANIIENPLIKDPNPFLDCGKAFSLPDERLLCSGFQRRYTGCVTFVINYWLHWTNVTGYHIINLAIHLINALLVYLLVLMTFRAPFLENSKLKDRAVPIGLFSALLFVSHPIQTQAVTYIVQRFTSLATMFYLLSLVLYIKARLIKQDAGYKMQGAGYKEQNQEEKQRNLNFKLIFFYLMSLISAILAMKTKEISFTLPVMIVLYEFTFFKGDIKRRMLYLVPVLLTGMIIPVSLLGTDQLLGNLLTDVWKVTRIDTEISRWEYLFTEFSVIVTYIRLILFPVNQNLDYDFPLYHSLFTPEVFLSFMFLLLLSISGIYLLCRYRNTSPHARLISFGIFWFFITLSVESSFIPIVDVIFEHRVYLPSAGVFIAIITTLFWVADKLKGKWKAAEKAVVATLTLIVVVLTGATYARNTVWQDDIRLWEDVVSKSPNKIRANYNLAHAYQDRKQYNKAVEMYNKVLTLDLKYFEAYNNLANIFVDLGQHDKAIEYLNSAIEINPNSDLIYYNRGRAHFAGNLHDKAIEDFTRSIAINPNIVRYYIDRGRAYSLNGQFDSAIRDFTLAININPNNPKAYAFRGLAYFYINDIIKAQLDFQKACNMGDQRGCDALKKYNVK